MHILWNNVNITVLIYNIQNRTVYIIYCYCNFMNDIIVRILYLPLTFSCLTNALMHKRDKHFILIAFNHQNNWRILYLSVYHLSSI